MPLIHTKTFIVEALALRLAIVLASQLRLNQVDFETDAQKLVTTMSSKNDNNMKMEKILGDISEFKIKLRVCQVNWIFREANQVANELARSAAI